MYSPVYNKSSVVCKGWARRPWAHAPRTATYSIQYSPSTPGWSRQRLLQLLPHPVLIHVDSAAQSSGDGGACRFGSGGGFAWSPTGAPLASTPSPPALALPAAAPPRSRSGRRRCRPPRRPGRRPPGKLPGIAGGTASLTTFAPRAPHPPHRPLARHLQRYLTRRPRSSRRRRCGARRSTSPRHRSVVGGGPGGPLRSLPQNGVAPAEPALGHRVSQTRSRRFRKPSSTGAGLS
jgi:hypothetical protein